MTIRYNKQISRQFIDFTMPATKLYALDFDGVICDSAVETAITGWKAADHLWHDMPASIPQVMIDRFREVRPIIETGYEAILAMRLLFLGEATETIFTRYHDKIQELLEQAGVDTDDLKKLFGETRDNWIDTDLNGWIAMNPLFPGIVEKLRLLGQKHDWYVITTKQERFVKHIFNANGIPLSDDRIYGLDRKLSKAQVLNGLVKKYPHHAIHFVEDRLPTLINIKQHPDLADIRLYFAPWGYNTIEDKAVAQQYAFTPLRLEDFLC